MSIRGHNSFTNLRKMCNNPNLDLININANTKFGKILSFCSQDVERKKILNEILTSIKDQNSIINVRKTLSYIQNLDLVNINAYTKFGEIQSICSQDIERK